MRVGSPGARGSRGPTPRCPRPSVARPPAPRSRRSTGDGEEHTPSPPALGGPHLPPYDPHSPPLLLPTPVRLRRPSGPRALQPRAGPGLGPLLGPASSPALGASALDPQVGQQLGGEACVAGGGQGVSAPGTLAQRVARVSRPEARVPPCHHPTSAQERGRGRARCCPNARLALWPGLSATRWSSSHPEGPRLAAPGSTRRRAGLRPGRVHRAAVRVIRPARPPAPQGHTADSGGPQGVHELPPDPARGQGEE